MRQWFSKPKTTPRWRVHTAKGTYYGNGMSDAVLVLLVRVGPYRDEKIIAGDVDPRSETFETDLAEAVAVAEYKVGMLNALWEG